MSPITTHILDTSEGRPAQGVLVQLFRARADQWEEAGAGRTDADGRIRDLLPEGPLEDGTYRIRFESGLYHQQKGLKPFYPFVEIVFEVAAGQHYHIPLLLNPYGYSTYRGS